MLPWSLFVCAKSDLIHEKVQASMSEKEKALEHLRQEKANLQHLQFQIICTHNSQSVWDRSSCLVDVSLFILLLFLLQTAYTRLLTTYQNPLQLWSLAWRRVVVWVPWLVAWVWQAGWAGAWAQGHRLSCHWKVNTYNNYITLSTISRFPFQVCPPQQSQKLFLICTATVSRLYGGLFESLVSCMTQNRNRARRNYMNISLQLCVQRHGPSKLFEW